MNEMDISAAVIVADASVGTSKKETSTENLPVLEAKNVYILMSKDHRISRNRRAEWFFSRFDSVLTLPHDVIPDDESSDFYVVSAVPKERPKGWSAETRHLFRYKITTKTVVIYLSRRYRIVYCIDVSPSVAAVDVQAGTVVFDRVFQALKASLDGLMRPFYIPGSTAIFQPKIFITVITHSPFISRINNEAILQGKLLGPATYTEIIDFVFERLNTIENLMAETTSSLLQNLAFPKDNMEGTNSNLLGSAFPSKSSITVSSDFSLVDLLKQALIALSLLPENSSSGLVILSDGVVSVPDGRYMDIILSTLRYIPTSCSFIQLSSQFHPHLCHGVLPYADLMKFIASATFGVFLTEAPEISSPDVAEMNVYHHAFLAWSFQNTDAFQTGFVPPQTVKPGEWSIRNKCFFTIRDMPIVKKQQYENSLTVDYMKVLSCRLREGFMIKEINLNEDGQYEIKLTLPWKFLIHLEYVLVTNKTPQSKTGCILSLEGPYDFLHDVTCLASRSFPSIYRQLMVNRFWATRKNLSESDRLLVHLNSFSSNPAFYNIPDNLRNGVPLFYFQSSPSAPVLQPNEFPFPQFAQFWKPVCMLDTTVWQKWMHTHRIGIILEHDHPLPKHLHFPNPTGRFHVVYCRQAIMELNTLLKNMSSFVLVENHSYVKLMYTDEDEKDKAPFSFYIIRVTSKPPYVVLRLAFLVGTPGNLRHQTVSTLRDQIASLTFPQRLKEPPRWRFPSGSNTAQTDQTSKATWSDMHCCILMQKPIERILIRYEKVPDDFREVLMPQHTYDNVIDPKSSSSKQSTFGFRPTHSTPGTTATIMVPEVFNSVARYLYHRRWIWAFPKVLLPHFKIEDASEILSIITKRRLQEGFRFAYSSAGTVSMVMEVQMQNETTTKSTYSTPCVLQFVIFPPSLALSTNFEEEIDTAEDVKDIYLTTECWVEPQCGKVSECQFSMLNQLEFFEVPNQIFEINNECFLTIGAFEYLRGICKSENATPQKPVECPPIRESNILLLPFEFELGRVLPKCSQSELLFSMFFQDLSHTFVIEAKTDFIPFHERANEVLYNVWISNLARVHDREIVVESKHYEELLTMVLSREDVGSTRKESKCNVDDLPSWKCFVKYIEETQLLVTLLPRTLRDAKLLFLIIEKCKSPISTTERQPDSTLKNLIEGAECLDSSINSAKPRQRKVSEPNFSQKMASLKVTNDIIQNIENCTSSGRKRLRALSGGESAPVLKKPFTIDSSCHEQLIQSLFDESQSKYIFAKVGPVAIRSLHTHFVESDNEIELDPNEISDNSETEVTTLHELNGKNLMIGSLSMPLFIYDCSLSTLRENVIFKSSGDIIDSCLDFRIFTTPDNIYKSCDVNEATSFLSCSTVECPSPDMRKSYSEDVGSSKLKLQEYCRTLQLAYKASYVRSVYQSLQLGYYISTEDLYAVIYLCNKDEITLDITEYLKNVCMHTCKTDTPCSTKFLIHNFIQKNFRRVITHDFSYVKADTDLFYFKSSRINRHYENLVGCENPSFHYDLSGDDHPIFGNRWSISSDQLGENSIRRDSERGCEDAVSPLFMYMKCKTTTVSKTTSTKTLSNLPVCIVNDLDIDAELEDSWTASLQLVFLTSNLNDSEGYVTNEISCAEECRNISNLQLEAIKHTINEVNWLLNDEITSMRSNFKTVTLEMLNEIASHVDSSTGKQGCSKQAIPLKFVCSEGSKAYDTFLEKFSELRGHGFAFRNVENWWYVVGFEENSLISGNADEDSHLAPTANTKKSPKKFSVQLHEDTVSFPFWIIFRIEPNCLHSYFQCRYDEEDLSTVKRGTEVKEKLLTAITGLIRVVNQDMLLQNLHDSRSCSQLLEPEKKKMMAEENRHNDFENTDEVLRNDHEGYFDGIGEHLTPGMFSCDVVWETSFKLHPRLRPGPGKSVYTRGIQILRSMLLAFEVNNRENMFVYRNTIGHVFYLRLHRVYETIDDVELECASENPTPRSSVSSKSRSHHLAEFYQTRENSFCDTLPDPSLRTVSDGIVLLKVHGVTEAGTEIKEQLIQSLRNKLDDAVLDVLSITLDRNPHCKLTPEDVYFIQRPLSTPDVVFKFSTGKFTKLLLPAFVVYLHQNLLQFLNIPKYTRPESEFHFQDYHRKSDEPVSDEPNVYLYNQNPGETGSRGVACVAVSLIDKFGTLIKCLDIKRPCDFLFSLSMEELSTFIETDEILQGIGHSDIVIEVCVWKQGRINLEVLKNNFSAAIKHAGWDLAMEYQVLIPPLFASEFEDHSFDNSHPISFDGENDRIIRRSASPNVCPISARTLRRRNSSAAPLISEIDHERERGEEFRGRAASYTSRRNNLRAKEFRPDHFMEHSAVNTMMHRDSSVSSETIRSSFDYTAMRKNAVETFNNLHENYGTLFKRWCSLGTKLNLPSLRIATIRFKPYYYLDETLEELIKIINSAAPDNSTAQCWKISRNIREFFTVGKDLYPESEDIAERSLKEIKCFKSNERKLKELENQDESEYPTELLKLFKTQEHFQPSASPSRCILIARNIMHWEACINACSNKQATIMPTIPDAIKNLHKFYPLMSDALFDDKSSLNAEKLKFPARPGVLTHLNDLSEENSPQRILIPRQRFFSATLSKYSIELIFYNWSKESSDKVVDQLKSLASWNNSRIQTLSSILLQKSGIFYNQPTFREDSSATIGSPALIDLIRNSSPIRINPLSERVSKKDVTQVTGVYRNLQHTHLLKLPDRVVLNPIIVHGEQFLSLLSPAHKGIESSLFQNWLSRGPSASNVIGVEAVEALKQAARTIHYCMTPIFFLPRWRNSIALTRDNTLGIFKRAREQKIETKIAIHEQTDRLRHASDTSFKSLHININKTQPVKLPTWSLWKRRQLEKSKEDESDNGVSASRNPKKTEEQWHLNLCNVYIQEYMQYLQTLGFIPTHSNSATNQRNHQILTSENWAASYVGRLGRVRRMSDGSVLSMDSEITNPSHLTNNNTKQRMSSQETDTKIFYLQKSLPGGIILLEVGFMEPFSYCKIHALECTRFLQRSQVSQKATTFHNTLAFVDECDKMKVLMHLHSFAYDFHLRYIQSHIYGKQVILPGYHVTKFLDDFVSYYSKGPNFARNTVNIGVLSVQNVSTPSHILFKFLLTNHAKYRLAMLKMNPLNPNKYPDLTDPLQGQDCALVYSLSKKFSYKESEDESHFDEFEMLLVISYDSPILGRVYSADPSVLRVKYYIVLTSRKELYPKLAGDASSGKLHPVVTSAVPLSANSSRSDIQLHRKSFSFDRGNKLNSVDEQLESDTILQFTAQSEDTTTSLSGTSLLPRPSIDEDGIKEERVHYMGYFSSHEQMMQEILKEQTSWAERFIDKLVDQASVDCRRDLLWRRLQVGGKLDTSKKERDELTIRETQSQLSFWEFSELLELIHVQPLRGVDPRLKILLNQPLSFFECLIRLLTNVEKTKYAYRHFVAPDGKIHQLAIINPKIDKSVVMIEMNMAKRSNDLSIILRDAVDSSTDLELDPEILNLIETAIGACCYCNWINCL